MSSRWVVVLAVALSVCGGCARKPNPRFVVRKPPKPWIGTRSLCIFPMVKPPERPEAQALAAAMAAGWKARLDVPDGSELVKIEKGPHAHAGHFETISIDLSDVRVDPENKQRRLKPLRASQGTVTADRVELVANPLLVEKARLLIGMTATNAKLDVRRDKQGRSMLTLTDAKEGVLTLEVPRKDIDWLLLHAARQAAGKLGIIVDRTRLKLDVENSRTIRVDLKIDTRVALLPAGFRFRARVDIDDELNGTMTKLSVDGDQLLGPIISSLIEPQIKKYEGKTRPLVGFEWGELKLRDVTMTTDDAFRLEAKFGSVPGANRPVVVDRRARKRAA